MNVGINPFFVSVRRLFFRYWRPAVLVLSLATVTYLLYFRQLNTLLPGYAQPELNAYVTSSDWHHIADNPVGAPYSVLVWIFGVFAEHNLQATRAVAAWFGTLAVLAFFAIIRHWYSFRIAFLGTLLFATSAGFLHYARLGTPQILQMSILALLAMALWYRHSRHRSLVGYIVLSICAVLLYVPGMIWFELLGALLVWRSIWGQLHRTPPIHILGGFGLFLAILTPLISAAVRNPDILLAAAGLPTSLDAISHSPDNLWRSAAAIGIWGVGDPLTWLARMPLLDVAERILCAIGAYYYLYRQRSLRGIFLAVSVALSLVLISIGGDVGFAVLVPLLYLFIVHGLDHLLDRWFVVFPRNPIARYVGVAVLCVMLFFSIAYQTRSYFVAWPHNAATKETFNLPSS